MGGAYTSKKGRKGREMEWCRCVCGRLKDGREVLARDGVVMTSDDHAHRLVIRDARDSDAGVYKCILRNAAGETAATATLSVRGTPRLYYYHFYYFLPQVL